MEKCLICKKDTKNKKTLYGLYAVCDNKKCINNIKEQQKIVKIAKAYD